jgi:hypothetical protein
VLLVVVAIGTAVVAVLLARAVLSVPEAIEADDARLARADLAGGVEIGVGGVFGGVAEALVGAGDDQSYRKALQLYAASSVDGLAVAERLALHGEAEAILTRLVQTDGDGAVRAHAANLLGVMLLEDARLDPASTRRFLDLSLGAFQDAVRLDPTPDEAKHNLELLATLPPDAVFRDEEPQDSGASATPPADPGY